MVQEFPQQKYCIFPLRRNRTHAVTYLCVCRVVGSDAVGCSSREGGIPRLTMLLDISTAGFRSSPFRTVLTVRELVNKGAPHVSRIFGYCCDYRIVFSPMVHSPRQILFKIPDLKTACQAGTSMRVPSYGRHPLLTPTRGRSARNSFRHSGIL